jgi:hypothetical protein
MIIGVSAYEYAIISIAWYLMNSLIDTVARVPVPEVNKLDRIGQTSV